MRQSTTKQNAMQAWVKKATIEERKRLAKLALTTPGHIMQIAGAYRTDGVASTTPELARRLEAAAIKIHREGLPELVREDLCIACGRCELARKAREIEKEG